LPAREPELVIPPKKESLEGGFVFDPPHDWVDRTKVIAIVKESGSVGNDSNEVFEAKETGL
jgi:hypothetical protein